MMSLRIFNTLEITVRDLLVIVDTNWLLSDLIGIYHFVFITASTCVASADSCGRPNRSSGLEHGELIQLSLKHHLDQYFEDEAALGSDGVMTRRPVLTDMPFLRQA